MPVLALVANPFDAASVHLTDQDMAMLTSLVELELLRRGQVEADLPFWDGKPWPARRTILRVGSLPSGLAEVGALDGRPTNLCRMLRMHFDRDETAPWAFIPGKTGILLLQMNQAGRIDFDR